MLCRVLNQSRQNLTRYNRKKKRSSTKEILSFISVTREIVLLICVKYGTILLTGASAVCLAFAPQIIGIFRDDPEVIAVGSVALRAQAISLPLMATIVITNMMLQSTGKGLKASIASSARNGIFFIPAILLLPYFFGLTGVELAQAAADVCAFALSVPLAVSELKRMRE